jgi:hypothetical protein
MISNPKTINMARKIFAGFLLIILISGCDKSEEIVPDLKGTLKGRISTLDEFGNQINDNGNILIQLEGTDPLLSTLTDITGRYEITGIPTGTYNLAISKESYGTIKLQGSRFVGGSEPVYFNTSLVKESSTTIENLSLETVGSAIYAKGIVNHNYSNHWSTPWIILFIHNENNPSGENYLQDQFVDFKGESGSELYSVLSLDRNQFPSGSTIYVVAYGRSFPALMYIDIFTDQLRYSSLGKGSNIASITIP